MRRSVGLAVAGAVGLVALGWSLASADTTPEPPSSPSQPTTASDPADFSAAPAVAIVATEPRRGQSALYLVSPTGAEQSSGSAPTALAELHHLPEGNVRAEVLPGTNTVVANAPTTLGGDLSFNGALYALRPGTDAEQLCANVVHASRPLVTPQGRVFVSRGTPGPWPADPGRYRVDGLTIDEVDPSSGKLRRVHDFEGYLAHLAGWHAPEVLLYRVGRAKADIIAVHAETGAVRPLLQEIPPFARDFSVDSERGVLVYRGRHESDSRRWVVDELDLGSGVATRLHQGTSFALAPHAWPGGAVAINPQRRGLQLLGSADPVARPLGSGVDVVRGVSYDRRFVTALHTVASRLPVPFVVDRHTGRVWALRVPAGHRAAIAGFVETAEGTP